MNGDIGPEPTTPTGQMGAIPALPPRVTPEKPAKSNKPVLAPIHTTNTSTATLLASRQSEFYGSQGMAMHAESFANTTADLTPKIEQYTGDDRFWPGLARDYSDEFIRSNQTREVERRVLHGMPDEIRAAVYMKTMQVKALMDSASYSSLGKRAKMASFEAGKELDAFGPELAELMQIFELCVAENASVALELSRRIPGFIVGVAPLVRALEGVEDAEALALLLKFSALYTRLIKEEFSYKASRALEDVAHAQFVHITKQGIDLNRLVLRVLNDTFLLGESETLVRALDLVVFEGFDFLIRVLCAKMQREKDAILALHGDELAKYILSDEFLAVSQETLADSTRVELPLVKYENEFHLMYANNVSGNDNELTNLKETNHDLALRISDLTKKLEGLRKTHNEILIQSEEYTTKLDKAKLEREQLTQQRRELEEKYARLTMQENLSNTIKANKDISKMNAELELQISEMQAKVEKNRAKLSKAAKA